MKTQAVAFIVAFTLLLAACGGEITETPTSDSVPSGTYEGTITDIILGARTLTVSMQEEDTLRAFFTDSTRVLNDSIEVGFGSLVADERVRVTVEQGPERLNATHIEVVRAENSPLDP